MAFDEEEYLQLSGIQHFLFCRRQWALVHVEQQWEENYRTADGRIMHKHVHDAEYHSKRKDLLTKRAMRVYSAGLGLSGECDLVEFHQDPGGIELPGYEGLWMPYPVEYKRGKKKDSPYDEAQLCAQAMCLEEMMCCSIEEGALYYGETRHREAVRFSSKLRTIVSDTVMEMHSYMQRGYTPKVKQKKACKMCSLINICAPELLSAEQASAYIRSALGE